MKENKRQEFLNGLLTDSYFKSLVLRKLENHEQLLVKFRTAHMDKAGTIDLAIKIIKSQQFSIDEEIEEDFQEIHSRLFVGRNATSSGGVDKVMHKKEVISYRKWWYLAASIMIAMGIGYGVVFYQGKENTTYTTADIGQFEKVTKSNPRGIKSVITLNDGSLITLNSESSVTYPKNFNGKSRVIELNGEAFFEVQEDKGRPFIVMTGNTTTTALGTSFNIRHFPEESESYISLATGKVLVRASIGKDYTEEVLLPGEQIISMKDQVGISKKNYNYKEVFLWKEKVIYWQHADWKEISNTLERWYGVKIAVEGLNKPINYSGQFDDQSLENVLLSMGYTLGFQYEKMDESDTIKILFSR